MTLFYLFAFCSSLPSDPFVVLRFEHVRNDQPAHDYKQNKIRIVYPARHLCSCFRHLILRSCSLVVVDFQVLGSFQSPGGLASSDCHLQ